MLKNLLAVRVDPWQLFRFKKYVSWRKAKPSWVIQEALQHYFASVKIPEKLLNEWLNEYHKKEEASE
jgi:hypothetical protein